MNLPLVERELLRAGRSRTTYAARLFVPGLSLVVLTPQYVYGRFFGGALYGDSIADELSLLAGMGEAVVASFVVAWLGSRAIADEAQDDTLDLVTLADKSHVEYYAGKFISVWFQALMLLASILPVRLMAGFLGDGMGDVGLFDFARTMLVAAIVCSVSLFFSALLKRAGRAFIAILLAYFVWVSIRRTAYAMAPPLFVVPGLVDALTVVVGVGIAVAGIWGTLALLRHPEFNVVQLARRRRRLPWTVTASASVCVAHIVQREGGGIATFAQTWWLRAIVAAILALLAYGLEMPTASLVLGAFVGAEAFVVGGNLRERGMLDDLALTSVDRRSLVNGMLVGQFARALVFLPAAVFSLDMPRLAEGAFGTVQWVHEWLHADMEMLFTVAGFILLLGVAIAYAVVVLYFFTAVGIHYAVARCTAGRMAGNLLALMILVNFLTSLVTIGYTIVYGLAAIRSSPPTGFSPGWGEVLAVLVIVPMMTVEYRNRLRGQFTVPEGPRSEDVDPNP